MANTLGLNRSVIFVCYCWLRTDGAEKVRGGKLCRIQRSRFRIDPSSFLAGMKSPITTNKSFESETRLTSNWRLFSIPMPLPLDNSPGLECRGVGCPQHSAYRGLRWPHEEYLRWLLHWFRVWSNDHGANSNYCSGKNSIRKSQGRDRGLALWHVLE